MLTLYYSPLTRASRIMAQIEEMGIADKIDLRRVDIVRADGSGRRDPANAHPEGKVPYLIHDGAEIWESTAIALYLTELFPDAGLGRAVGDPERGPLLSWLAWYGDVVEPLIVVQMSGLDQSKVRSAWRGISEVHARIESALSDGREFLLKGGYSIADLIVGSAFLWNEESSPKSGRARDWVARCGARPAGQRVWAREMELMKAQATAA